MPSLARQWWASIGVIAAIVGIVLDVTGIVSLPPVFWILIAITTVAVASFQLFHDNRVRFAAAQAALAGPSLPYWEAVGLRGARGGVTYLDVMASSDQPDSRISTADFPGLREQLLEVLRIEPAQTQTRSFADFFEISEPYDGGGYRALAKVDATNKALFIKVSWRMDGDQVGLRDILSKSTIALRALRAGACHRVLGRNPWYLVALGDWPVKGVRLDGVIEAKSWAQADHRGQPLYVQSKLRANESEWLLVVKFANRLLADAGYINFEEQLEGLKEDQVMHVPATDEPPQ